jgi:hypothetical protein
MYALPIEIVASDVNIEALKTMGFEVSYKFPDKYIRVYQATMYAVSHAKSFRPVYPQVTIEILSQLLMCPTSESRAILLDTLVKEEFEKHLKVGG